MKQFNITGYTPAGYPVTINFEMENYPDWSKLDERMQTIGLTPPPAPMSAPATNEQAVQSAIMTHVALRNQYNDDGTITPHVAFYHENSRLQLRYLHIYLDAESQQTAFEQATGLLLDTMHTYDADTHPKRDDSPRSKRYIQALPHPVTVQYTEEDFTGDDGREGKRKRFLGYLNTNTPQPPPAPKKTTSEPDTPPPAPKPTPSEEPPPPPIEELEPPPALDDDEPTPAPEELTMPTLPARAPANLFGASRGSSRRMANRPIRLTRIRVSGKYLEVGDIISHARIEPGKYGGTNHAETWRIESISPANPPAKRNATVIVNGTEKREVEFLTGLNAGGLSMYTVVGGPKLIKAQDDPTCYGMNDMGAFWNPPEEKREVSA